MRSSIKPGAEERWQRRFRRVNRSPHSLFKILLGLPKKTIVGVAILIFVLIIALWDKSIRRFLEGVSLVAPGVGLLAEGYPAFGIPMIVAGSLVSSLSIYIWNRGDKLYTIFPTSNDFELTEKLTREPMEV